MEEFITSLNQNQNGAIYQLANGNQIIGSWNKQASAQGFASSSNIDINYQVIVTLNPDKTFGYIEKLTQTGSDIGFGAGSPSFGDDQSQAGAGGIPLAGMSKSVFKGKTFGATQKGFNMQFGGKPESNSYSYSFEAEKIKQPLFAALKNSGYSQKKGFFGKLFGK